MSLSASRTLGLMPLLAPQHKLVLRHLLSRNGTAHHELSTPTGLEPRMYLTPQTIGARTDLAAPMPPHSTSEGPWSLPLAGQQVGLSLAKDEMTSAGRLRYDPAEVGLSGDLLRKIRLSMPATSTNSTKSQSRDGLCFNQVPNQPRCPRGLMATFLSSPSSVLS